MQDVRLKLSPPWITYLHELTALFDADPQIAFNTTPDQQAITISCNNGDKCAALAKLLPEEKTFGNITFKIAIDGPMSNRAFKSKKELFETAFEKNPVFSYAVAPAEELYWYPSMTYVVFKNTVVQFFNDNLNDCHGIISTLYQDIAADIFKDNPELDDVYYNTDIEAKFDGPLGEWP